MPLPKSVSFIFQSSDDVGSAQGVRSHLGLLMQIKVQNRQRTYQLIRNAKWTSSLFALTSERQIRDKEKNMRAALLVAAIAGVIFGAYAYQSSGSDKSKEPRQQSSTNTGSTTDKPKLGYPDPYIPPTKGNGF